MAASKLVCRGSGKFCRKPSHAIGLWLLLASFVGFLLLCVTYMDVTTFYLNSYSKELQSAFQRGTDLGMAMSSSARRSKSELPVESTLGTSPPPTEAAVVQVSDPPAGSAMNHAHSGSYNNGTVESLAKDESLAGDRSNAVVNPGANETPTDRAAAKTMMRTKEKKAGGLPGSLPGGRCEISQGRWVYDETYPLYRSRNCPFVDPGFRCEENGRPDLDFMQYRWQPRDCDLPRFNPVDMLERLRDQRLVFVGDSLGRNQWESMLCMLAEGVPNKSRIFETSGQPITKHMGSLVFLFQDYNCTVEYYRDPYLVPQTRPPSDSPSNVTNVLKIDQVSWSMSKWWPGANILVLNSGHWWSYERIFNSGGRFQMGDNLTTHSFIEGFKVALKTWTLWMEENLDPENTQLFFRSYSPVHFRGGVWNGGGHCDEEQKPLTDEEVQEMQETPWTNKLVVDAITRNVKTKRSAVEYMDVTTASDYRADGHGGLYTKDVKVHGLAPKRQQDCSHFCLPGVPDTWNELLYASLLARGQGAWGQPVRY